MSAQMSLDTLRHSPSRSTVEQKNEVEDGPATQGGVNQRYDLGEKEEDCFKAIQEAEILNASQSRFGGCAA